MAIHFLLNGIWDSLLVQRGTSPSKSLIEKLEGKHACINRLHRKIFFLSTRKYNKDIENLFTRMFKKHTLLVPSDCP